MTLVIDSVINERVHGRVTWYSAGDLPGSPSHFRPVTGETMGDSAVHMHTALIDEGAPTFHFMGNIHGDTIQLRLFVIGVDTLSGPDRGWRMVRK